MKTEEGVMVLDENGKAWQLLHADGYSEMWGYGPIETGKISDPKYCKTPTDMTWAGSHYTRQLLQGSLVRVVRETVVKVKGD